MESEDHRRALQKSLANIEKRIGFVAYTLNTLTANSPIYSKNVDEYAALLRSRREVQEELGK